MIIADLFVNLGIKGAEKTVGALTGIEKSLKGLGSMSLEAKAAILGAMYALERLFSRSGQAGTDLTNFSALLGGSTKTLQQYQYAARQVGVSNQETENTFKSLQSTMTKLRMGEGAPKGYAQVAMLTGGITPQDVDRFMQNPELLLQKLQQYAQKEKRIGIRNEALKSFGLSDNMVAALSRNAFNPTTLQKAPTYSEKEISALDKANIAWSNLGTKIEMAIGHFNALHGGELVKDFTMLTDKVMKLTEAFLKLAETIHLFEGVGKVFEGLSLIFGGATDTVNKLKTPKGRESLKEGAEDFIHDVPGMFQVIGESLQDMIFGEKKEEPSKPGAKRDESRPGKTSPIEHGAKPSKTESKNFPSLSPSKTKKSDNVINFFHKEPGIFKPITEDLFGKTPGSKIPESAVVKQTQSTVIPSKETTVINNVKEPTNFNPVIHPGKESTIIKGGKESTHTKTIINPGKETRSAEKPSLRLVVPQSPTVPEASAKPNVPRSTAGKTTTQNFNVNQSFSFASDGKDRHQVADTMKKAVSDAFRQMSSQVQGS